MGKKVAMQTQAVLDQTKVDQFVGKVLGDTSATLVTCWLQSATA